MSQNVTMFPVEVNILNQEHVLKPGMNTEVEIHVGNRQGVLAVPNAALRTPRDVGSAASVLGLDSQQLRQQHAVGDTAVQRDGQTLHAAEPKPAPTAGGSYLVFALGGGSKITLVPIRTGLTDQDYVEVTGGLTDRDTVLVLTSTASR